MSAPCRAQSVSLRKRLWPSVRMYSRPRRSRGACARRSRWTLPFARRACGGGFATALRFAVRAQLSKSVVGGAQVVVGAAEHWLRETRSRDRHGTRAGRAASALLPHSCCDHCTRLLCATASTAAMVACVSTASPCRAKLRLKIGTEFLVAGVGLALIAVLQARSLRAGAAAISAALALIPTASWLAWAVRWRTAGPPQLCFRIHPILPIPRLALALSLWAVPCAISGCRRSVLVGACGVRSWPPLSRSSCRRG